MSSETTTRFDGSGGPRLVGPGDGKQVDLTSVGVRFMIWSGETGGQFSLVEHPIPPRTLVAPLHRHSREDEYSFVLEGRMGAVLGDDIVHADAGDLVFKPRNQWHSFWNADEVPCRILEMIAPGGFESYFDELAALAGDGGEPPLEQLAALGARYGIDFDPSSIERLCREHGLNFPG